MPIELVEEIAKIVTKEDYLALKHVFPDGRASSTIFLSQEEVEALIELAVVEKKKARLRYPHYDDEHPEYDEEHAEKFDDVQMGICEKTIYYVESAFKKGMFDQLLS